MPDIFISSNTADNSNNTSPDPNTSSTNTNTNPGHQNHTATKEITGIPGMLSTFVQHPQKLTFTQQDEDEEIIIFVRRHFVTNLPWIIAVIIALVAPLFIISLA